MRYPTLEEVNAASRYQICTWWRFLPSPGTKAIDQTNFTEVMDADVLIMNRIAERFKELGGFNPFIGWEKP